MGLLGDHENPQDFGISVIFLVVSVASSYGALQLLSWLYGEPDAVDYWVVQVGVLIAVFCACVFGRVIWQSRRAK